MKKILIAKSIFKSYTSNKTKNIILENIDLNVFENESIAIMGASGEGKTTLLHILAGLENIDLGNIEILGEKKYSNKLINEKIGFIFQSYNLLNDLSVIDNILMPAKIARKNISKTSIYYNRAIKMLEEINLINKKDDLAIHLSGGEKQRTSIARAFCNNPEIIFADEPSGNLDSKNSKVIHDLLINSCKTYKKTLILATHDLELAKMCDKIFQLKDKKLTSYTF
ncbi:MAG: Lipoprotein-releasing system ATP-binding protein LolD [Candidatus Anoxychlamydiales bacterium]|nr:Lipoprotein-releasing system ATP-binding protein LolD [Candidatus Anoxychlamydiales bacterium]